MDNEEDEWVEVLKRSGLEGKHFEAKGVSRGEFEALKRFGIYNNSSMAPSCGSKAIRNIEFTARTQRDGRFES